VRRLFLVVLSSAILLAACGSSKTWPGNGSGAPTQASTTAATAPSEATPTIATPTTQPSEATPTDAPADTGIVFTPSDGTFSVSLPGQPKLTTQTYKTAAGDAPANIWTYEVSNDLAYFVVEAAYPKGSMSGVASSSIFDGAINGMVNTTAGASIKATADTTRQGHAGRTFSISTPAADLKGALYIVGDDMYMVYAGYTSAISDLTVVDSFLDSFEFPIN
jgi:hypothetical protein